MEADINGILLAHEGHLDMLEVTGVIKRPDKAPAQTTAPARKLTPALFDAWFR